MTIKPHSYIEIAYSSVAVFANDGELDLGELNFLLGLALRDNVIDEEERLGSLTSLSLMAGGISEFTITNETRLLLPPEPLYSSIARTGPDRITVSWPNIPCNCYGLESATNLAPFDGYIRRETIYDDFQYHSSVDTGDYPEGFFKMRYNYPR